MTSMGSSLGIVAACQLARARTLQHGAKQAAAPQTCLHLAHTLQAQVKLVTWCDQTYHRFGIFMDSYVKS